MFAGSRSAAPAAANVGIHLRTAGASAMKTMARRFALDRQLAFWARELAPAWSRTELRARVIEVTDETHDVKTFVLAPNARWAGHRAGQFVGVDVEVDGVRLTRCYSLSSAPRSRYPSITVKRVPGGRVSSWMHDRVRRGDIVRLTPPAGTFVLSPGARRPLLLLSGGSGVTPVMSILRDLSQRDAIDDVLFVHAARSERDVIFRAELEGLAARHAGLRLAFFLDDEGGRLDRAALEAAVPDLARRDTFMCGPAGMMDALSPIWADANIAERLKTERFAATRAAPRARSGENVKLFLARSGRTVAAEGSGTLLEQLEAGREQPAYGCRMGICNTCRCRKRSGVVEDTLTGLVSREPDEDIRLCVSRALTDVELAL